MPDLNEKKVAIIGSLKEKSSLKQKVFDNTAEAKIQHSRVITGKRLGFQFNSDDVLNSNPDET